jgi:hypothetical protein
MSPLQSSSLLFRSSKTLFHLGELLVSMIPRGAPFSSYSAGWHSILHMQWIFNSWVWPPWRTCANKVDAIGDHPNRLNAATP